VYLWIPPYDAVIDLGQRLYVGCFGFSTEEGVNGKVSKLMKPQMRILSTGLGDPSTNTSSPVFEQCNLKTKYRDFVICPFSQHLSIVDF
jgi:hypothetical protein